MKSINEFGIEKSIYHLVVRSHQKMNIIETENEIIDINSIEIVKRNNKTCQFRDKNNSYSYSKSTIFRSFVTTENEIAEEIPINFILDSFKFIESIDYKKYIEPNQCNEIILPLYSEERKIKKIFRVQV